MFASARRLQATPAYTQLLKTIKVDLKQAMLAKEAVKKNTIRAVLSAIKNSEIDGAQQTEHDVSRVLNRMIKQRIDLEQLYKGQNRPDLAAVEGQEQSIIRHYVMSLPVASQQEVEARLEAWMRLLGDVKLGAVYKQITPELAAQWSLLPEAVKPLVAAVYKKVFT